MFQERFKGSSRQIEECFEGALVVFKENCKEVHRVLQGVSKVFKFQGNFSFNGLSCVFKGCFKNVSRIGCFKDD